MYVSELEQEPNPFRLCHHLRDWLGGESIMKQMCLSINLARRIIVVLTPNLLQSTYGLTEFRIAHELSLKERRARVIIVIYGDIGNIDDLSPELKAYLQTNTYLKWGDPWFFDRLRYSMPHRREGAGRGRRPSFSQFLNMPSIWWFCCYSLV